MDAAETAMKTEPRAPSIIITVVQICGKHMLGSYGVLAEYMFGAATQL